MQVPTHPAVFPPLSAAPTEPGTAAAYEPGSRSERNEQIYQSLPPLGSPAYLSLLKSATTDELPASVLVRAYRQLHPSPAADATLDRLLGYNERYDYITTVYLAAGRRVRQLDAYSPDDLVCDTIGEIVATLAGPMGEGADRAWVNYLHQCMERAYRRLVGRRGGRGKLRVASSVDEPSERYDDVDAAQVAWAPWQGRVAPSVLEWLEPFIEQTLAGIPDERMRAVGCDLYSDTPTAVSSSDPDDPNTLAGRFRETRFKIYKWQRHARVTLLAALERQNEREIDLSFLTFPR